MLDVDETMKFYYTPIPLELVLRIADENGVRCLPLEEDGRPFVLAGRKEAMPVMLRAKRIHADQCSNDKRFQFQGSLYMTSGKSAALYRAFIACLADNLPGDIAECGALYGETASDMVRFLEHVGCEKVVHLFDSFEGFPDAFTDEEAAQNKAGDPYWNSRRAGAMLAPIELCEIVLEGCTNYRIHQGFFSDTFPAFDKPLCFIHADADLYHSTREIIELADRCLVPGGTIVFDDYGDERFPGVKQAVEDHLDRTQYELEEMDGEFQAMALRAAPCNEGGGL